MSQVHQSHKDLNFEYNCTNFHYNPSSHFQDISVVAWRLIDRLPNITISRAILLVSLKLIELNFYCESMFSQFKDVKNIYNPMRLKGHLNSKLMSINHLASKVTKPLCLYEAK